MNFDKSLSLSGLQLFHPELDDFLSLVQVSFLWFCDQMVLDCILVQLSKLPKKILWLYLASGSSVCIFIHSFLHPLSKQLLSTYCVLGTCDSVGSKTQALSSRSSVCWGLETNWQPSPYCGVGVIMEASLEELIS